MILFVCTGNTCRSPMAAVLAQKLLREAGVNCAVQSAGVYASPSCAASRHAISAMHDAGCDLLAHRSQQVTPQLIDEAALILTMTEAHRIAVFNVAPHANDKVFTLSGYAQADAGIQNEYGDVADTFGGDLLAYQQCAAQIIKLLTACSAKLISAGIHLS